MKKTISMKMFITEFGENFSDHMKEKLLELEIGCVLTRKEDSYRLDLKHVEHKQYDCPSEDNSATTQKEYAYGQFLVIDNVLYFTDKCNETNQVMKAPIINTIFDSLSGEGMIADEEGSAKILNDNNIDYVIDTILSVFPEVSQAHLDIVKDMTSRSETKVLNALYSKTYN
jgi:hypothetical protein